MSLRTKLLALFGALAVAPLVAVGVFDYVHSMRALQGLVAARVDAIAERAARELSDRYALRESELLLLAENAETQQLYRAYSSGDPIEWDAALSAADEYLRQAWQLFGTSYRWVELHDTAGALVYRLDEVGLGAAVGARGNHDAADGALRLVRPIRDLASARRVGTLDAALRLDALLPREALEARFGRAGYTVVLDRSTGQVLYHPRHAFVRQSVGTLVGPGNWNVDPESLDRERGKFVYREADSTRVASFASLTNPPWTVVASGAVDEFEAPFTRMRTVNLAFVLVATAVIAAIFVLLIRGATRSLARLTAAADEVALGNFAPELPPGGQDEVGRLSAAFGLMVRKLREMVRQIEASRHMAAVGEFASQLSHEIRNPLTSLKLNLQRLERDVRGGRIPTDAARPVTISVREIERLDRVVRGVLALGRSRSTARARCSIHAVLAEALEVVRAQLDRQGVAVEMACRAPRDTVWGDAEQLKAAFLNLLLNATEAMPEGGKLYIATEGRGGGVKSGGAIRVRVADDGPGIPPDARDRIFQPFYTTKADGTGFGLPLALRVVEDHRGRLELEQRPTLGSGAELVVDLPVAADESDA